MYSGAYPPSFLLNQIRLLALIGYRISACHRSFMSTKMKSRVKVSRRGTHVGTLVNLPPELGGTGDSYHDLTVYWKRKMQEHACWFAEAQSHEMGQSS